MTLASSFAIESPIPNDSANTLKITDVREAASVIPNASEMTLASSFDSVSVIPNDSASTLEITAIREAVSVIPTPSFTVRS